MSEPYSQVCELEGGGQGVLFNYLVTSSPYPEHLVNARTVADYWQSLGMTVRLVETPTVTVYAEGGLAARLSFSTEPGDYGIGGASLCVPGNADDFRGGN
jgi:ABC-type transport system substrate-binding protein